MSSPTQRSKRLLEDRGYLVAIVEHWNAFARLRQDLYGFVDLLAVARGQGTLAVQTTSYANVPARVRKIADSSTAPVLRDAGWRIEVHGWRKDKKGKWTCRIVDLS